MMTATETARSERAAKGETDTMRSNHSSTFKTSQSHASAFGLSFDFAEVNRELNRRISWARQAFGENGEGSAGDPLWESIRKVQRPCRILLSNRGTAPAGVPVTASLHEIPLHPEHAQDYLVVASVVSLLLSRFWLEGRTDLSAIVSNQTGAGYSFQSGQGIDDVNVQQTWFQETSGRGIS